MEAVDQDTNAAAQLCRPDRIPEVDWLKGFAIISVLLTHARPLYGTAVQNYLIFYGVPILIVLFGVTSELWWRGHRAEGWSSTLLLWYRTRLWRLMVPVWGMLLVWYPLSIVFDPRSPVSPGVVAATAVGYMPWVGTGWFVTLILELVILFPLLHLAINRLGGTLCVIAAAGVFLLSYYFIYDVISLMRILLLGTPPSGGLFYYYPFWIFAPARLLPVVAGMMVARHQHVLRWKYAMVAALLVAVVIAVLTHAPVSPHWGACLSDTMAIPLTLLLLVFISGVGVWGPVASALAWCGRSSWGIYLGQMIVHNGFHIFGHRLETSAAANRWVYFVCLFVGAVGFVTIGNAIRQIPRNDWIPKRR